MRRRRFAAVSWVCGWISIHGALAVASEPPRYNSRTWQTDEGLPQYTVQAVAQSTDGYLWVGTLRGLARFDGVHFKVFDSENTPAIKNSSITALWTGRNGKLWIGTGGSGLVEMQDGHFTNYSFGESVRANTVKCVLEARDGSVWAGTLEGLFHYQSGRWTHYTTKDGLVDDVVRCLLEQDDGLLIGAGPGLHSYKDGVIKNWPMPPGFPATSVHAMIRDKKGDIWLAMTGGLVDYKDGRITVYSKKDGLSDDEVTAVFEDRRGNLWIGISGGLFRMSQGKFLVEKESNGGFYDRVNTFLEDQEGDLWVGARDGLHQLRARRFLTYSRPQGLPHNNIMSVLEDRSGSMWLSTWGGGLVQMKDGEMTNYTRENSFNNGLGTDLILSLFEDRDGSILIGTDYEGGTFRFYQGRFTPIWGKKDALTNRVVRVIHRDKAGNLWFGASPGLVLDATRQKFLERATIRCMTDDADGVLWVGSNDGLFRRRKDGGFERLGLPGELEHQTVIALYADKENALWIGTEKNGLGRWKDGHYTSYRTRNGLWSDEVFAILEDDQGWLWMGCTRGVFRVSKANIAKYDRKEISTLPCIAYGKADGMESIQCNGVAMPSGWKSRDGRLWFATTKGVVVTDPGAGGGFNDKEPEVRIEEAVADRQIMPVPGDGSTIRVPPGRGELEFHYTALSLAVPEKNQFRYRLLGVDPDWVDAGTRRVAYYNNLRPGEYEFQVLAANNDGVWNMKGAKASVKLLPHYWQSLWFTVCTAVAMAGIIGGAVRNATRTKLQRELHALEKEHAVESERTRIARDMHDDLGARLTEILLLNELAQKNTANPEGALTHLDKQSQVIQDVAGSLDAIVWAVNPVNDSLDRLANYLYAQAERLLSMRFIRCRFDVPDELPNSFLSSQVRHNVFMAVRETLNNVIKHSGASEVWFRLRTSPTMLTIVIEDNGEGFSPDESASIGNGLHNIEKRMKNLGGSFHLTTQPGKGTSIRLEVPFKADSAI